MPDYIDGSIHSDNSAFHGPVIGVNLGTIIYGRVPEEQERQRLVGYLENLVNYHCKMRIAGLGIARLESGVDLSSVYIMLAVQGEFWPVRQLTSSEEDFHQRQKILEDLSPDRWLPDKAILYGGSTLYRATLATEMALLHQHLVICGPPGSGKSTFVKHLVWTLAKRGLDQIDKQTNLVGWPSHLRFLPIFIPLRHLAGELVGRNLGLDSEPKMGLLINILCNYLSNQYGLDEPYQLLTAGLKQQGKVLFLFDGLDEVPLDANQNSLDRKSLLKFLCLFADYKPKSRMLITCRSRAWTDEYRNITKWPTYELAPLTGGQITHFINYWYPQLVSNGVISSDEGNRYSKQLLDALNDPKRQKLRMMAENPLLLSMMLFSLADNGVLPRDRHNLYEQILVQLLGQWDSKREGQSLGQAIGDGRITSQELRNRVLDRICYHAHLQATSEDGRGRIQTRDLEYELLKYFDKVKVTDPYRATERCVAYIDERSGLLQPEDEGNVYAFAHLTLQEYSAGRYLLSHEPISQIFALRHDDRWYEPIFLGLGCLTNENMGPSKIGELLAALIDPYDFRSNNRKPIRYWYRDLVLAAELGLDRDWDLLNGMDIDIHRIKRELRQGLAQLLNDRDHAQLAHNYAQGKLVDPAPLVIKERQHAAELLAGLGDPRYPTTSDEWQHETRQLSQQFGREGMHYWRYVPAGSYQVGGWNEQEDSISIDLQPYWVGRFMITIEQYHAFINAGGYKSDTTQWWTKHGLEWKNIEQRTKPWSWDKQFQYEYRNQPVYGVSWYEAVAYCNWLNESMRHLLPHGYKICLASESEWEISASYNAPNLRQPYPWGIQPATPDHAVYNWVERERPLSVGLCVVGQSGCGAADTTGNLWEWTATPYQGDLDPTNVTDDSDESMVIRGHAYYGHKIDMLCVSRHWFHPLDATYYQGFRCYIAPRSIVMGTRI